MTINTNANATNHMNAIKKPSRKSLFVAIFKTIYTRSPLYVRDDKNRNQDNRVKDRDNNVQF
jgi:hypothetical protein